MTNEDYLFERWFMQAAHISILEEALAEARSDMIRIVKQQLPEKARHEILEQCLKKIDIAYRSIEKLKNGPAAGAGSFG